MNSALMEKGRRDVKGSQQSGSNYFMKSSDDGMGHLGGLLAKLAGGMDQEFSLNMSA